MGQIFFCLILNLKFRVKKIQKKIWGQKKFWVKKKNLGHFFSLVYFWPKKFIFLTKIFLGGVKQKSENRGGGLKFLGGGYETEIRK